MNFFRNDDDDSEVKVSKEPIDWNTMKQNFLHFLNERITWNNTKETAHFLFVIVVSLVTVTLSCLQYLGDFSLRFFREFNHFIHVTTPTILAIIDLIKKIIGGLLICLMALIPRGHRQVPLEESHSRLKQRMIQNR